MKSTYKKWIGVGGLKCYCCRVGSPVECKQKTHRADRRKRRVELQKHLQVDLGNANSKKISTWSSK